MISPRRMQITRARGHVPSCRVPRLLEAGCPARAMEPLTTLLGGYKLALQPVRMPRCPTPMR
jgi:hypothetical protein